MNIHQGVEASERETLIVRFRRQPAERQLLYAAAAIALIALLAWLWFGRAAPAPPPPGPAPVGVIVVREEPVALSAELPGRTSPFETSDVRPQVDGIVRARLFTEGDYVRAGQPLYRIDPASYQAKVASARAALARARASTIAAEGQVKRYAELVKRNFVSRQLYDNALSAAGEARADVEAQAAALRSAQIDLDRTTIRAPFDGTVSSKPAVAGSIVQAGTELMKIIRDGRLEVGVLVPEKDLASISIGQKASVVDASGRTFSGSVSSIAETVNSTTRLATVYVSLGEGSGLKSGMFARVSIATAASQQLSVAEAALVWHDGKPAVFVVDAAGKANARPVATGARQSGRVAIESGLSEGDHVVIAGAGFLSDGNLVRVASSEADAGAATPSTEAAQ